MWIRRQIGLALEQSIYELESMRIYDAIATSGTSISTRIGEIPRCLKSAAAVPSADSRETASRSNATLQTATYGSLGG